MFLKFHPHLFLLILLGNVLHAQKEQQTSKAAKELASYKNNPLPLNEASIRTLQRLGLLSKNQVDAFLRFMHIYQETINLADLSILPYWNPETVTIIKPYIQQTPVVENTSSPLQHAWRLDYASGVGKKKDQGLPHQLISSYTFKKKNAYEIGLLGYKGEGELYKNGFYRGYALLEKGVIPYVKRAIIGRYNVHMGKGLIIGKGGFMGDTKTYLGTPKNTFTPYKQQKRAQGLYGAGVHLEGKPFEVMLYTALNTYLSKSSGKTIQQPGLQTTVWELSQGDTPYRNGTYHDTENFSTKLLGGGILYHPNHYSEIGFHALKQEYSNPVKIGDSKAEEKNSVGLWGSFKKPNYTITGEGALSSSEMACLLSQKGLIDANNSLIAILKYYSPAFYSFYGDKGKDKQSAQLSWEHKQKNMHMHHTFTVERATPKRKNAAKNPEKKITYQFDIEKKREKLTLGNQSKIRYIQDKATLFYTKIYLLLIERVFSIKSFLSMAMDTSKQLSIGFCQNVMYTWGNWQLTWHHTLFHSCKQPLYFWVPDIYWSSTPQLVGKGLRWGASLAYTLKEQWTLKCQLYTTYKWGATQKSDKKWKWQLCYNA